MQILKVLPFSFSGTATKSNIALKKAIQEESNQFRGEYLLDSNYGASLVNYKI